MMNFGKVIEQDFSMLPSLIDNSVNFSKKTSDNGMIETRFVRRLNDRFIVYISSMTGCDKACRFCHLTQTGQTMARHLSVEEMVSQAALVLSNSTFNRGETVHFNFMSRGEPLSNKNVSKRLFENLRNLAFAYGLKPRIKISTIIPLDFVVPDWNNFVPESGIPVDIYYSLYRMDMDWRKRWIPKSLEPAKALGILADYQQQTGQRVILHWALMDGENDSPEHAIAIGKAAELAGLSFDFNLVRYNAANDKTRETPREAIDRYLAVIGKFVQSPNRVKEIPRVGFDVSASCGMFLNSA